MNTPRHPSHPGPDHRPEGLLRPILVCLTLALATTTDGRAQLETAGDLLPTARDLQSLSPASGPHGVLSPAPAPGAAEMESWASCGAQHRAAAYVCCDGEGGFAVCRGRIGGNRLLSACIGRHEQDHLQWFAEYLPDACEARPRGACRFNMTEAQFRELECSGYLEELRCLTASRGLAAGRRDGVARLVSRQRQLLAEAEDRFACRLTEEGARQHRQSRVTRAARKRG